jgi:hypothetical protein
VKERRINKSGFTPAASEDRRQLASQKSVSVTPSENSAFQAKQYTSFEASPRQLALRSKSKTLQSSQEELMQRKFKPAQRVEEDELLQGKFKTAQRVEEDELLQGKFKTAQRVQDEELLPSKQNDTGLPDNLKSGIEALSGISMDEVRVHYNSPKPAQLNAHAYAQGNDIHVGSGQEKHLPHEAWHVVQQAQGRVRATTETESGVKVNDEVALEREADTMGARALQAKFSERS